MLATTLCRDSDPADSSVNGHFRSFRAVYSRHTLREGARSDEARDILGHANIDVTQNVYSKNCWEERDDVVPQAVAAMTNAAQNAEKEENQPESAPASGGQIYKLIPLAPRVALSSI
jgi:hypothetical protein